MPQMPCCYNDLFQTIVLKPDFLYVAPLRCVDDSYGVAHMPWWCCHKCYISPNVSWANCGCVFPRVQKPCSHEWCWRHLYATRVEPRGSRSRNHGLPSYTHVPNVIAMFSCWCFVLFSQKFAKSERAARNSRRSAALAFTKHRCA